ncbi:GlxA family transcriptional regulator [Maribacter aestuarii]|uniref:GlxA family transcriptional regulator n=1 Tax=Maribacter aestuarii TaxID=1130723 RepID=UPI00248C9D73|nr:DJ-1/PfpI family protein [Maribacter aestuarii]
MSKSTNIHRIIVFLCPPKVHLLDISGSAHVFYEAMEMGAPIDILFAGINSDTDAISSAGLSFSKLVPFTEVSLTPNDFVIIPGSEDIFEIIAENKHLLDWLSNLNLEGVNLCSICIGSFWLAEAGILNNRKSTTHWKYFDEFTEKYPQVTLQKDKLFVIEENLYSSAGVSSGMDLSLHILEQLFGFDLSLKVSKEIVYFFRRAGGDPQLSTYLMYRNHIDTRVHDAQDFIMKNINTFFNIDDVADLVHMSKRNLSRRFKNSTGLTIGEYIGLIRVERASNLLEKRMKMEQITGECGLRSTNQLRTLLRKHHIIN